jgi:2-iminobutanoate/2-iminopropanoate deaminase
LSPAAVAVSLKLPVGRQQQAQEDLLPKKHVSTALAPRPIGPYSQGVISGGFLFISGQIPLDPQSGELISGDIEAQTEQVLKNVMAILKEAKIGPDNVVKATLFLTDLADFPKVNEVYGRHFGKLPPARSTIQVAGLPKGARLEMDVIAAF